MGFPQDRTGPNLKVSRQRAIFAHPCAWFYLSIRFKDQVLWLYAGGPYYSMGMTQDPKMEVR